MRVGRTTEFMVGWAVLLAVVLSVGTAALAVCGQPCLLGKNNVATKVSALINRGAGSRAWPASVRAGSGGDG
ncbi:MAG: hypothetical protein ACRDTR_22865 [Rubrobacter sp.]